MTCATESTLQTLHEGIPIESSSTITRRVLYDRLHDLLRHLLSLVPTLSSTLQPLLVKNFPHKRQNQITQTTYIRNLLRVSIYCPELADKILATIVDRVIQIDVSPLFKRTRTPLTHLTGRGPSRVRGPRGSGRECR